MIKSSIRKKKIEKMTMKIKMMIKKMMMKIKKKIRKNNPKGCYRYMTKHLYEVQHYLNPIPLPAYANTFSASDNKGYNINSSFKAIDYTIKESYATTN